MSTFAPLEILGAMGFKEQNTGGGCTALRHDVDESRYILVTDGMDARSPTDESEAFTVGFYEDEEEATGGACSNVPFLRVLAFIVEHMHP